MKAYEAYAGDTLIATGNIKTIASALGLSERRARSIAYKGHTKYTVIEIGTIEQIYAYYSGDTFMAEGSIKQIADESGELEKNINFLRFDSAKARNLTKTLIKLEGETMIQRKSIYDRHAPVPAAAERREEVKSFKNITVKPAEWKPSAYTKMLFDAQFKKWA